jgi:hypothetical protein
VEDQHGGGGEFRVTGTGRRVDDPNLRALASAAAPYAPAERHVLFELFVEDALQTVYAVNGTAVRPRWRTQG